MMNINLLEVATPPSIYQFSIVGAPTSTPQSRTTSKVQLEDTVCHNDAMREEERVRMDAMR